MKLCFIVDVNVAWVAWPLWRRGFMVFFPARDYPVDASDAELAEWALKTGCVLVTSDEGCARLAERMGARAVHVPHWWGRRYNSWEIVTRIVKHGAREVTCHGR